MAQWVKDLALSLQWLRSLLWHRFDPWSQDLLYAQAQAKKQTNKRPAVSFSAHQIGKHFKDGEHLMLMSTLISRSSICTVRLIACTFFIERNVTKFLQKSNAFNPVLLNF